MSQQGGSSVMSADNPEAKYKKALKQISKLINTNKSIRQQSQQARKNFENQLNEFAIRYNNLENAHIQLKKEYDSIDKIYQELQQNNSQLRKQLHIKEKQFNYLNEMLAQQNQQLKKVQAIKDQKKIAQLIRSYEDKQQSYLSQRKTLQDVIKKLRQEQNRRDDQLNQQKNLRQQAQDKYQILADQINKYKQFNAILIARNQKIYHDFYNKQGSSRQKQRQIQSLIQQFKKQINSLKSAKETVTQQIGNQYQTNYELILQQKNRVIMEYAQLKDQYEIAQNKITEMYGLQENLKSASIKLEKLNDQCNMLKSKIVVLEARDIMDEGVDFQYNPKQFDQKITALLSQSDPLITIKNSDETSHFRTLQSFIIQLRQKLQKVHHQRKQYMTKYKSVSTKYSQLVQDSAINDQQNKILKGKIEGFEKLTQKLQNQLQKNIMVHQSQMAKLNTMSNQLINRKNQEIQSTAHFMKQQIQQLQDRSQKTQKNLKQQIQALKLQLTSLRIKNQQKQQKLIQYNQFITIYKKKFNDINQIYQNLQQKNNQLNDKVIQFQNLYKQEKSKNDILNSHKNQLSAKLSQINQDADRKTTNYQQQLKLKSDSLNLQIKKNKTQNLKLIQQLQNIKKQYTILKKQYQQKKGRDYQQIQQLKRQNIYFKDIQNLFNIQKNKTRQLQTQNQTLIIKNKKYFQQHQRNSQFQQLLIKKNDQCNDFKRKIINLQSNMNILESNYKDQKNTSQNLRKQVSKMRMKLLQSGQEIRKQFDIKDQDSRQTIFKLTQEVSDLSLHLNEERNKNAKLNTQIYTFRSENQRLEQYCQEIKQKQSRLNDTLAHLKAQLHETMDQNQKNKSEFRMLQLNVKRLTDQVNGLKTTNNSLIQQISEIRMKQQQAQNSKNNIIREIQSLRFYFNGIEQYIAKSKNDLHMTWEQQKSKQNISQIIIKLKKLLKNPQTDSPINYTFSSGLSIGGTITSKPNQFNMYQDYGKDNQYTSKQFFISYADRHAPKSQHSYQQ